jgi:hypothetical protein
MVVVLQYFQALSKDCQADRISRSNSSYNIFQRPVSLSVRLLYNIRKSYVYDR